MVSSSSLLNNYVMCTCVDREKISPLKTLIAEAAIVATVARDRLVVLQYTAYNTL